MGHKGRVVVTSIETIHRHRHLHDPEYCPSAGWPTTYLTQHTPILSTQQTCGDFDRAVERCPAAIVTEHYLLSPLLFIIYFFDPKGTPQA